MQSNLKYPSTDAVFKIKNARFEKGCGQLISGFTYVLIVLANEDWSWQKPSWNNSDHFDSSTPFAGKFSSAQWLPNFLRQKVSANLSQSYPDFRFGL